MIKNDNEDDEMVFNDDHTVTEEDSLSHGFAPVNEEVSVVHSLEDNPQALEDVESFWYCNIDFGLV